MNRQFYRACIALLIAGIGGAGSVRAQQVLYATSPTRLTGVPYFEGPTAQAVCSALANSQGLNALGTVEAQGKGDYAICVVQIVDSKGVARPSPFGHAVLINSPDVDPPEDKSCQAGAQFGNPIAPVTGEKIERIQDLLDPGAYPLAFERIYGPADADPAHNTIAAADLTWAVGYDNVGRITSFNATDNTAGFGYDANGNRSSSMRVRNGQTTERAYTADTASNRLSGFAQTINGASNTSVVYGYNANGDLVSDGLRSFTYDAEGRLAAATTGASDTSPTTRYAHNALGQRVFKTDPLYPPAQGDENDPGFMQSLMNFFTRLWSPVQADAEKLGSAYVYDEQGTLLSELGTGGANGTDRAQYIYLPTANGPMPIAFIVNGTPYAVYSDHLNTPRKLTNADGLPVWQWNYSAFGEDKPTILKNRFADLEMKPNPGMTGMSEVKFNLRYPGQYYDQESGLNYNYFRSYNATTGRYSQGDPIGLDGGWNRFGYVDGNPLGAVDPAGLAACMVEFPDMPIDTGLGFSSTSLGGHGGVLGYGSDGATRYYEYGRYPPNASGVIGERLPADDGNYRRLGVPNLKMGRDGEPTPASLDALKGALSRGAGKGTPVTLTCTKDANEKKVYDYAEQLARNKSRPAYSWKPWSANQCRTFARDALGASR